MIVRPRRRPNRARRSTLGGVRPFLRIIKHRIACRMPTPSEHYRNEADVPPHVDKTRSRRFSSDVRRLSSCYPQVAMLTTRPLPRRPYTYRDPLPQQLHHGELAGPDEPLHHSIQSRRSTFVLDIHSMHYRLSPMPHAPETTVGSSVTRRQTLTLLMSNRPLVESSRRLNFSPVYFHSQIMMMHLHSRGGHPLASTSTGKQRAPGVAIL